MSITTLAEDIAKAKSNPIHETRRITIEAAPIGASLVGQTIEQRYELHINQLRSAFKQERYNELGLIGLFVRVLDMPRTQAICQARQWQGEHGTPRQARPVAWESTQRRAA